MYTYVLTAKLCATVCTIVILVMTNFKVVFNRNCMT